MNNAGMTSNIEALKRKFREGHHAEAIAGCEALCEQSPANHEIKKLCATMHAMRGNHARALELLLQIRNPAEENPDVLFNIAMCERELKNFQSARQYFRIYTEKFPHHPDGWTSQAECAFQLNEFDEGIRLADKAIAMDAAALPAWTVRGHCQKALGQLPEALASYDKAIQLAPQFAKLRVARGDTYHGLGRTEQAVADYKAALALTPADGETLKKTTLCLLELGKAQEGVELCREILKKNPDNLTAKLGVEWLLSQQVPLWHIPMMNEQERNQAFYDGLRSIVTPEKTVFEIGTGSGLLAMMAAKLGATSVTTCEAVPLIASTAARIIRRNNFQDRIRVLSKPSYAVQPETDLSGQADILVHEIFSSELLGEHVLPAIEDAKARLLKPGGEILPRSASIMIALVGGTDLEKNLHAGETFGFDVREFNAIYPKKRPLQREDLALVMMSDDIEAFRFDFAGQSNFPAEQKRIDIRATQSGLSYGVIQWIRIELSEGVFFENHPSQRRSVSNWQHTLYGFETPLQAEVGATVAINALHDRARPWFELAGARQTGQM
jgi:tetratricopeptide (TPR) repeat protein